ncbi:hypothetical protein JCM10908_001243 [Rhodotorula pacifica]|uniref:uncharacterized protein n=1 Tax=Rhodotorula pacifica TaxID=1495444 RepID=UPI00317F3208
MGIEFDSATLALASVAVLLSAVTYKLLPAPPLVHPFLLGRQAIPAPTRLHNQSPIYTNAANGGGRPPYRPDRSIRTLHDILKNSQSVLEGGLGEGALAHAAGGHGHKVVQLVLYLRAALANRFVNAGKEGTVLVALDDPTDALLVTLALALSPYKPIVLAPGSDLGTFPENCVASVSSPGRLTGAGSQSAITLVLDPSSSSSEEEEQDEARDLLESGKVLHEEGKDGAAAAGEVSDVVLTIISDGQSLQLTNQNLTASLISWASLFPVSPQPTKPTLKDSILSFHHPSTPYGFGLALFALSHSAGLAFPVLPSGHDTPPEELSLLLNSKSRPPATLIFAPANVLAKPLYQLILSEMLGDSSFIVRAARDGKLRLLREGIVTKQSFWDALLYKGLRKDINLTRLRALFLSAPPALDQSRLETLRASLGCPVVPTLSHPSLLAPLCAAHMFDLQRLPPPGAKRLRGNEKSHVGPPTLGVEVKLVGGKEEELTAGRIKGEILVRTPVLPLPTTLDPSLLTSDTSLPPLPPYSGQEDTTAAGTEGPKWYKTGVVAEISTEGTIWLDESESRALV